MAHKSNGHNYQFYGVGMKKAKRRSNGARPRKMYPYATKDQMGTPMETFIKSWYDAIEAAINAKNPSGPGRMEAEEATGGLGTHWKNIKRRLISPSAASRRIAKYGGSMGQARMFLIGLSGVNFGADPKSK